MPDEQQACRDAGMDEFLCKPVVSAELVQALLRCRRVESESNRSDAEVRIHA